MTKENLRYTNKQNEMSIFPYLMRCNGMNGTAVVQSWDRCVTVHGDSIVMDGIRCVRHVARME